MCYVTREVDVTFGKERDRLTPSSCRDKLNVEAYHRRVRIPMLTKLGRQTSRSLPTECYLKTQHCYH